MLFADLTQYITPGIVTLLVTILTGTAVTVARAWRLISKCKSLVDSVEKMPTQIAELKTQVDVTAEVVKRELTANGGGSIKDAVTALRLHDASIEARHRVWASFVDVMAWEADAQGYLVWASSRLLKELQRQDDEVFGDGWRSAIALEHQRKIAEDWDLCVRQRRAFSGTFAFRRADKTTFAVEAESHLLRHKNEILGSVTVARVIV